MKNSEFVIACENFVKNTASGYFSKSEIKYNLDNMTAKVVCRGTHHSGFIIPLIIAENESDGDVVIDSYTDKKFPLSNSGIEDYITYTFGL